MSALTVKILAEFQPAIFLPTSLAVVRKNRFHATGVVIGKVIKRLISWLHNENLGNHPNRNPFVLSHFSDKP